MTDKVQISHGHDLMEEADNQPYDDSVRITLHGRGSFSAQFDWTTYELRAIAAFLIKAADEREKQIWPTTEN